MGDLKTKIVDGITPNFESTDSKDFVGILNKIAEAMGGVPNMGVFADITQITQSNELMADASDQYIAVTTKQYEKPHRDLQPDSDETDPFQLELDCLVGKTGNKMPSDLSAFLDKKDNPSDSAMDDDELDDDVDDEIDDDDDSDDGKSIGEGFKEVGKAFRSAFKNKSTKSGKPFDDDDDDEDDYDDDYDDDDFEDDEYEDKDDF